MNNRNYVVGDWIGFYKDVKICFGKVEKLCGPYVKIEGDDINYYRGKTNLITSIDQLLPFKVDCKSIENSYKVQEFLFDNCFVWSTGDKILKQYIFLHIWNDKEITFHDDVNTFHDDVNTFKEIPVELLLWLGRQNKCPKCKSTNINFTLGICNNCGYIFDLIHKEEINQLDYELGNEPKKDIPDSIRAVINFLNPEVARNRLKHKLTDDLQTKEHTPIDINLDDELNKIEGTFSVSMKAKDIPVGTYFTGSINRGDIPSLFVKSYDNIVNLINPDDTWDYKNNYLTIYNYKKLNQVSISYVDSNVKSGNILLHE
jgi:hypothetical protein